jgi:hypothetical protein
MSARTAVGAFCVSALVAGGLVPATAFAKSQPNVENSDEVRVRVCKVVESGDDDYRFRFRAWTQGHEDSYRFWLRDHHCRWFTLDYDRPYLYLWERNSDDYDVRFRVRGDYEWYQRYDDDRLKVKFEDDDPTLRIWVFNYGDED